MQQIAVRAMNLYGIQAKSGGALGGVDEGLAHPEQAVAVEGGGSRLLVRERHGRGGDGLPAVECAGRNLGPTQPGFFSGRLAACMSELDGNRDVRPPTYRIQDT